MRYVFVCMMLVGCSLPVEQAYEGEFDGYRIYVMLESATQPQGPLPLERYAEIQQATEQAWNEVHPTARINGALQDIYIFVPEDEDSFYHYCESDIPLNACVYSLHWGAPGPLIFMQRRVYEANDQPWSYGGVFVHELLHVAHRSAGGDGDPDHNAPRVWYHVAKLAYEYAGVPSWTVIP